MSSGIANPYRQPTFFDIVEKIEEIDLKEMTKYTAIIYEAAPGHARLLEQKPSPPACDHKNYSLLPDMRNCLRDYKSF
jgi:hypothetical protein